MFRLYQRNSLTDTAICGIIFWPMMLAPIYAVLVLVDLPCFCDHVLSCSGRETSAIRVKDVSTQISASVGAAVEATNSQLHNTDSHCLSFNRRLPKRHCLVRSEVTLRAPRKDFKSTRENNLSEGSPGHTTSNVNLEFNGSGGVRKDPLTSVSVPTLAEEQESLAAMVAVLCEQKLFLPLLRAFELFTPSSPLLLFIRFLQVCIFGTSLCNTKNRIWASSIEWSPTGLLD